MELNLGNLLGLQKKKIKNQSIKLRQKDRQTLGIIENFLIESAERSKLSYIVIRGSSKILASTPIFRKKFYFSNDIKESNYYKLLESPNDELTYEDFKNAFRNSKQAELTALIRDGRKNDRFVHLEKEKPIVVGSYFYTTIHVYEIGAIRRQAGKIKRKLGLDGLSGSLYDLVSRRKVEKIMKEAEERLNLNKREK